MSYSSVLHQGRAAFLARMRGRCRVEVVGRVVTDPVTGEVAASRTVLYEDVPFYARYPGSVSEQDHPVGGSRLVSSRVVVRVPHGFTVPVDALIVVVSDPDNSKLVGSVFRVASLDDQSQSTAQRLVCEDVQKGVLVESAYGAGSYGFGAYGGVS